MSTNPQRFSAVAAALCGITACTGQLAPDGPLRPEVEARETPRPGNEFVCRDSSAVDPGPNLVRRLTVPEYVASVRATLGVDVELEAVQALPADLRADGFSNTSASLIVTLEHVQAYEELAALAVSRVEDLPGLVQRYASCTELEDECERSFIEGVGRRLYRGPPTDDETLALQGIFAFARAEGDPFEVAAGFVLEAMLQSPRFLYRVEDELGDGSPREVGPHELAARLSYLVWNAPPDEALIAAAEAGELSSDEQIEAQVERMLDDPRARAASVRFVTDWLDLTRLDTLPRSGELYPDWTPALGRAMHEETARTFEHLLWEEGRPLLDVFNAQVTVASPELAEHYGLGEPIEGDVYDLSAIPERGGLLTQGAVLTVGGDESSMVGRGLHMLTTFLCGGLDDPPSGVDTTPPEVEPGQSQRLYSEERVDNPSCGGCHSQMEPLAWGLERFDAVGRYQLEDRFGNPLGEDGSIRFPGDDATTPYTTTAELMDRLRASERVRDCVTLTAAQYAVGRPILGTDGCTMTEVRDRFAASDGTYRALLLAIASSRGFRSIRTEEAP